MALTPQQVAAKAHIPDAKLLYDHEDNAREIKYYTVMEELETLFADHHVPTEVRLADVRRRAATARVDERRKQQVVMEALITARGLEIPVYAFEGYEYV